MERHDAGSFLHQPILAASSNQDGSGNIVSLYADIWDIVDLPLQDLGLLGYWILWSLPESGDIIGLPGLVGDIVSDFLR